MDSTDRWTDLEWLANLGISSARTSSCMLNGPLALEGFQNILDTAERLRARESCFASELFRVGHDVALIRAYGIRARGLRRSLRTLIGCIMKNVTRKYRPDEVARRDVVAITRV